jgi:hypothetical protein
VERGFLPCSTLKGIPAFLFVSSLREGPEARKTKPQATVQCVSLYRHHGETTIHIQARITETGAIEVSGQDVGKAPQELWGDEDYEYRVVIAPEQKDRLILALLEALYQGNPRAVENVKQLLAKNAIPYVFDIWV